MSRQKQIEWPDLELPEEGSDLHEAISALTRSAAIMRDVISAQAAGIPLEEFCVKNPVLFLADAVIDAFREKLRHDQEQRPEVLH